MVNKLKIFTIDSLFNNLDVVEENLLFFGKLNNLIINKNNTFKNFNVVDFLNFVEYSDLESCDFIYYPNKISKNSDITNIIDMSKKYGKKILLFYNDDDDSIFNYENSIIFRTSLYKSTKPSNYYSVPAFCNDLKKDCNFKLKNYQETPTIGFCGAITNYLRSVAINELNKNQKINKNFIVRGSFWGGNVWGNEVRKDYIENLLNSDFVLCVRGSGNFSYRLYESICMGKIPVIINTDIDIPFNEFENYNEFLNININEINSISDIILNYWNNINDYNELQLKLISYWDENFSPLGFIKKLNKYKNEINHLLH
jgi:hypothetical protein